MTTRERASVASASVSFGIGAPATSSSLAAFGERQTIPETAAPHHARIHPGNGMRVSIHRALALLLLAVFSVWPSVQGDAEANASPGVARDGRIVYGVSLEGRNCPREPCSRDYIEFTTPSTPGGRRVRTCGLRFDCVDSSPAVSRRGQRLLFDRLGVSGYEGGIFVSLADGRRDRLVVRRGFDGAWAPRGARLVFVRAAPEGEGEAKPNSANLFAVDRDGSRLRRLTSRGGAAPDWSSRGEIAFVRRQRDFGGDIYVMRPGRGGVRRLTTAGIFEEPNWSPDGRFLVVERRTQRGQNVFIIDRRGRKVRALTRTGGYSPAWSPSGRRVAYAHRGGIYVVNRDGTGRRQLVRRRNVVEGIDWAIRRP